MKKLLLVGLAALSLTACSPADGPSRDDQYVHDMEAIWGKPTKDRDGLIASAANLCIKIRMVDTPFKYAAAVYGYSEGSNLDMTKAAKAMYVQLDYACPDQSTRIHSMMSK